MSDLLEFFEKIPEFFKKYPVYTVVVVIILCVVAFFCCFPERMLKWMEYGERLNKTAGKRRRTTRKPYSRIIAVVIVVILVLLLVLFIVSTVSGNEHTDSSVTDSSGSSSEETSESSGEPVKESSYVVVQADISWSDAEKACEDDGGHLATITSREEYEEVVGVLESYIQDNESSAENLFYVWLGGRNEDSDSKRGVNNYKWITGEEWNDDIKRLWCNVASDDGTQISEPSFIDENTGNIESRLVLWKHEMRNVLWGGETVTLNWTFSDQNDDFLNLPDVSSFVKGQGRIAYICEYDDYTVDLFD